MARRRSAAAPEGGTTEQPGQEAGETQIEVKLKGTADDVTKRLGGQQPTAEPVPKEENGRDVEKDAFVKALRNAKYIIRVKRVTPREFNGVKTNVEVWCSELPLSYQEIQEEVSKTYMGGKYRVAVVDPSSSSTVAADTFEVDGDPNIPEAEASQEEIDRALMRGAPKDAAALTEEGLDRRARVSAKMLEVEALESQLEEARERRKRPDANGGARDTRVDELERRLIEAKHQAELEARDRKHAEEMRDLKALITQNAKPAKENDSMTILLEQMRTDRKASDDRFNAMMKQMQDEKMSALLDEVKSIKNKPQQQSGSLLEQAEAMLKMKKIFGWGGDDDGDDDGNDEDDTRPWYERALDKLGGKFGDKLLAKFTDMEEKGEKVDREAFIKEMGSYADQIAADAVARQQQTLPPPAKLPALPPPPAQLPPPPPAASTPNPVTQLPPPPPPAVQQPPALPSAPPQQNLTLEQEIMIRVVGTLEILSREMVLRPNEYHWNYEGCWTSLPEDILEKVCAAADAPGIIDALTIPGVDPAKAAELKEKIVASPRMTAWLNVGLGELKEWWAEKQKDPTFDPFEDDDDAGEGEVTQ